MSAGQTLRVLVNARLTAAAEEIFVLFERTTAEFEEELRRSREENQRKQELLDSVLSQGLDLGLILNHRSLNHQDLKHQGLDLHEDPWMKEEKRIKPEEEQLPMSSSVCVKREESSLLHQTGRGEEQQREEPGREELQRAERRKEEPQGDEPQGEEPHLHPQTKGEPSNTDNGEDCRAPFSCSGAEVETEADGDHNYQVQIQDESAAINESNMSGTAERADWRKHECSFCKKRFRTKHQLTSHISVHTGDRPFSCAFCGKGFVVDSKLRLHMRTHTGERPFSCSVCGKTFNQKAHLEAHTRIHTGDRPFGCPLCGKAFTQNSHLKGHMITHRKRALTAEQTDWTPEVIEATYGHLFNQM